MTNQKDTKNCIICGKEYQREDFPSTFNRMVTCGNTECTGQRRYQKWKQRYEARVINGI